ncbi:hypothetical protein H4R19_000261 [Coemansia spiralis]|nr:hypothetical protein H4R19_000261 [Coemansia spiralis]
MLQQYDILFAISTNVQSVLDAVLFAERVSMTSTHLKRSRRLSRVAPELPADIAPVQRESPRRMVAHGQPSRPRKNYLSDSDSSYFSPAMHDATHDGEPGGAAERVRAARTPRRGDAVPETLAGHIVVCDSSSTFPRSMELLVRALKTAFDSSGLPVVILSPGGVDSHQQQQLADLGRVFIVRGTSLSLADLQRTNIQTAQRAIVLSSKAQRSSEIGDSPAILANMNIQQLCGPQFYVTTELVDMESIRYLDHTQLLGSPLLKRTFMGGHIFAPSLLDSSLCQCYFSSHILDVLRQLTFSRLDTAAASRPGCLSLLFVPERFIGQRYDTLALTLMKQHKAVPLGLYRIVAARGQNFAAVMCNPRPALPLVASDAVYVLGPPLANWNHFSETLQLAAAAAHHEPASESSPATGSASHTTGTSQSRHTVYSHNITTPKFEHYSDAEADTSDNDTRDHTGAKDRPDDMV